MGSGLLLTSHAQDVVKDLAEIEKDLQVIDASVFGESPETVKKPVQAILEKTHIRSRDVYRAYLEKAAAISDELMVVRKTMNKQDGELSLQQLGAYTQALRAENQAFRDGFEHGEEEFLSYQLIQTAITRMEEAWMYWRDANKYRRVYRGTVLARAEDDEVLQVKLQGARQAIEELNTIIEARDALNDDLEFSF